MPGRYPDSREGERQFEDHRRHGRPGEDRRRDDRPREDRGRRDRSREGRRRAGRTEDEYYQDDLPRNDNHRGHRHHDPRQHGNRPYTQQQHGDNRNGNQVIGNQYIGGQHYHGTQNHGGNAYEDRRQLNDGGDYYRPGQRQREANNAPRNHIPVGRDDGWHATQVQTPAARPQRQQQVVRAPPAQPERQQQIVQVLPPQARPMMPGSRSTYMVPVGADRRIAMSNRPRDPMTGQLLPPSRSKISILDISLPGNFFTNMTPHQAQQQFKSLRAYYWDLVDRLGLNIVEGEDWVHPGDTDKPKARPGDIILVHGLARRGDSKAPSEELMNWFPLMDGGVAQMELAPGLMLAPTGEGIEYSQLTTKSGTDLEGAIVQDVLTGKNVPLLSEYVQINEATTESEVQLEPACKFPQLLFGSNGKYPFNNDKRYAPALKTEVLPRNAPYKIIGHLSRLEDHETMAKIIEAASAHKTALANHFLEEERKKAARKIRFAPDAEERLEESQREEEAELDEAQEEEESELLEEQLLHAKAMIDGALGQLQKDRAPQKSADLDSVDEDTTATDGRGTAADQKNPGASNAALQDITNTTPAVVSTTEGNPNKRKEAPTADEDAEYAAFLKRLRKNKLAKTSLAEMFEYGTNMNRRRRDEDKEN